MTSARRADVSLLALPRHARTAAVEISWRSRGLLVCSWAAAAPFPLN